MRSIVARSPHCLPRYRLETPDCAQGRSALLSTSTFFIHSARCHHIFSRRGQNAASKQSRANWFGCIRWAFREIPSFRIGRRVAIPLLVIGPTVALAFSDLILQNCDLNRRTTRCPVTTLDPASRSRHPHLTVPPDDRVLMGAGLALCGDRCAFPRGWSGDSNMPRATIAARTEFATCSDVAHLIPALATRRCPAGSDLMRCPSIEVICATRATFIARQLHLAHVRRSQST